MWPVCVDFETEAIQDRPHYPPKPVGVAVWDGTSDPVYWAWGHPTGNNCTLEEARARLEAIWGGSLLFHHAAFDLEVALHHLNLPIPPWERIDDTMFLLFLDDPHARSLSLKPAAERYLGEAPVEQDALRQHLVEKGVVRPSDKGWGAHISKGDGEVVGRYAKGDVLRTGRLFHLLKKTRGGEAYDRERRLLPILMENSRTGLRVDQERLEMAVDRYGAALKGVDNWLRCRLDEPGLNVDANEDLALALRKSGVVSFFRKTETGKDSVSKKNLDESMFLDPVVYQHLQYRGRLATALSTFMRPWLISSNGTSRIYTTWNQVRGDDGGTRTGRLSCTPNFQNLPKEWKDEPPSGFPALPVVRRYVLPDEGAVFCHRDFQGQELRVLAHMEDSSLLDAYRDNPRMDVHAYISQRVAAIAGITLTRHQTKTLVFGILYGMGMKKLGTSIGVDEDTAGRVRQAVRTAVPGLAKLENELRLRGRGDVPIQTWGGRTYHAEPGKEYKLLNYLVQGSSADFSKEAMIRYDGMRKHGRMLVAVHDEIDISVPKEHVAEEMEILREAMEGVPGIDCPMPTESKVGPNWGEIK
jgi:DNA polymerase I-like protein with 3'-5' exonuclease and polymerase domains